MKNVCNSYKKRQDVRCEEDVSQIKDVPNFMESITYCIEGCMNCHGPTWEEHKVLQISMLGRQ